MGALLNSSHAGSNRPSPRRIPRGSTPANWIINSDDKESEAGEGGARREGTLSGKPRRRALPSHSKNLPQLMGSFKPLDDADYYHL